VGAWSPRLSSVRGDVLDASTVLSAVQGMDAVLSALGTGADLGPTTLLSDGTAQIIAAMRQAFVKRLVCVTSGAVVEAPDESLFFRMVTRRRWKHVIEDQMRMESLVRASDLEWTLVRPARLAGGPRTGRYRLEADAPLENCHEVSRADVADFMLRELTARHHLGAAVALGY
jgi:putative NADH-flavin reductase